MKGGIKLPPPLSPFQEKLPLKGPALLGLKANNAYPQSYPLLPTLQHCTGNKEMHHLPFYIHNIHQNAQFYTKIPWKEHNNQNLFIINKLGNFYKCS